MIPYSQKVLTDVGLVSIGDVVTKFVGSKVLSFNHLSKSTGWSSIIMRKRLVNTVRMVSIDDFVCSVDHPIFTARGYVRADHVRVGDFVFSLYGSGFLGLVKKFFVSAGLSRGVYASKVMKVSVLDSLPFGFDLSVGVDGNYFLGSVLVHSND